MGGGASAKKSRAKLLESKAELLRSRSLADDQDAALLERAAQANQEREREELVQRLAVARAEHSRQLAQQRAELEAEHRENLRERVDTQKAEHSQRIQSAVDEDRRNFDSELGREEAKHRALVEYEKHRLTSALEEVAALRAKVRGLTQQRDSEHATAGNLREELAAERRSAMRQDQLRMAEVRTRVSESEALKDAQHGLDGQARALQSELTRVSYAVGQCDSELQVKNSELQEVRKALVTVQDDMDDVNAKLKEQCGRVQRVESSLRSSRDLGERVRGMREMLRESNGVLGQLCGQLEQERAGREQYTQGLRQQKVRTELLLQLLQHFKNRTQDLAPQVLLEQNQAIAFQNGQAPFSAAEPQAASGGIGCATYRAGQTHVMSSPTAPF